MRAQPFALTTNANATSASSTAASTSTLGLDELGSVSVDRHLVGRVVPRRFLVAWQSAPPAETGDAVLVAVEGNTYLSVPILDFGSEHDDAKTATARGACPGSRHCTPSATPLP